jgi:hypothetical protein
MRVFTHAALNGYGVYFRKSGFHSHLELKVSLRVVDQMIWKSSSPHSMIPGFVFSELSVRHWQASYK